MPQSSFFPTQGRAPSARGGRVVAVGGGVDEQAVDRAGNLPSVGGPVGHGQEDLPEGWICMKKVMVETETQWDHEERCHHIDQENCYQVGKDALYFFMSV